MSTIGYARVSSYGQSLDVQLEKLKHCDRIFQEKQSGRSTDKRVQLVSAVTNPDGHWCRGGQDA
jgi:DNA invertase Pin-like site-specific DNA recombinase